MDIYKLTVGNLEENSYYIVHGKEGILIDPGSQADNILNLINEKKVNPKMILLTHGHFDHIGAVNEIKKQTGAKVYIHPEDEIMLSDNDKNLSFMTGSKIDKIEADGYLSDKQTINIGDEILTVYYTPGHSLGSVCFCIGKDLFVGDLLFKQSIGRFDYGDFRKEMKSLKFLMDNFSDDYKVYPGHGETTTIGYERKNNPYIVNHIN